MELEAWPASSSLVISFVEVDAVVGEETVVRLPLLGHLVWWSLKKYIECLIFKKFRWSKILDV